MAKHAQVRCRHAGRRAGFLLSGAAVPLAWLMVAPAQAAPQPAAADGSATVGDAAEAWYAASPIDLCTTPLGCPPEGTPTSPYPADTLHVGVAGGQETASTYVLPDLLSLPVGATLTGGTMTLPLATETGDGTQSPDLAKVQACLVTQPITDGTQGSTSAPPKTDCKAASVDAKYDAKTNVFVVDLKAFADVWAGGTAPFGIALEPDADKTQPTDAWHVAFNGKKRADVKHVTSVVTYTQPVIDRPTDTAQPPVDNNPGSVAPPAAPTTPDVPLPDSGTTGTPPTATAPQVAPPTTTAPPQQTVALSTEFQYPMAFLLPLALLAGAVFFGRLFTRDVTPVSRAA